MKIFLTTVVEKVPREIRRSEMCPPPRDAKKRAKGGIEEARPFYKIINIESRGITCTMYVDIHLNSKLHCHYVISLHLNQLLEESKVHTTVTSNLRMSFR